MERSRDKITRPASLHHVSNRPPVERDRTARFVATPRNGRDRWYKIANYGSDTTPAKIYLYDEIGYWGTSAQDFVDELKDIVAREIHVHINSPGGEVFDGQAIHACLRNHPARITTIVDGLAASAASFIAQAGDHRVISRGATMMIHDASGLCWGNATDMHQMADVLDKLSDNIADIYANRGGGTVDGWREAMRAETWYTAAEALAAGLCDEMTDPDRDDDRPDEMGNRWDLTVFQYAGRGAAPPPGSGRGAAPAASGGAAVEPPPTTTVPDDVPAEPAPALPVPEVEPPAVDEPAATVAPDETPEPAADEPTPTEVELPADEPTPASETPADDEPQPAVDPEPEPEQPADDPEPAPAEAAAEPADSAGGTDSAVTDTWAGPPTWAHPTTETDEWNSLVANLTTPAPSTVDDAFARLREALT